VKRNDKTVIVDRIQCFHSVEWPEGHPAGKSLCFRTHQNGS